MQKLIAAILAVLTILIVASPSEAWHWGRHHYGWYDPWYNPFWPYAMAQPFYYMYAPPQQPIVIQQQPTTYVQQPETRQYYWYWCQDPAGYYPYVQQCKQQWMQVVPQTAPPGTPR